MWFKITELEERIVLDAAAVVDPSSATSTSSDPTQAPGGGGPSVPPTPVNAPATIVSTPVTSATEHQPYLYDVDATDFENNVLSYTLDQASLERGMQIETGSGIITWTPGESDGGNTYNVIVTVSQATAKSVTQSYSLSVSEVDDPPTIQPISNATVLEHHAFIQQVNAADPDSPTLTYSLSNAPAGMSITPNGGLITFVPNESQGGLNFNNIQVNVSDGVNPPVTTSFNLTVSEDPNNTAWTDDDVIVNFPYAQVQLFKDGAVGPLGIFIGDGINGHELVAGDNIAFGNPIFIPQQGDTDLGSINLDGAAQRGGTLNIVRLPSYGNLFFDSVNVLRSDGQIITLTSFSVNQTGTLLSFIQSNFPTLNAFAIVDVQQIRYVANGTLPSGVVEDSFDYINLMSSGSTNPAGTVHLIFADHLPIVANQNPDLANPGAQSIDELAPFSLQLLASDPDLPAQPLVYSLVSGPAGLSIDSSGLLSWTPTEVQGAGDYTIVARVDDGAGGFDQESFVIHVNEVNINPDLANPGAQSIYELAPFTLQLSASDSDLPANSLTYSLVSGPAGLSIDSTGLLSWTPTEAQGPGDYTVVANVDDGAGGFDQESFVIHVNEVNSNPDLANPGAQSVNEGQLLAIDLSATDSDLPANGLIYSLVSGPAGLTIAANGHLAFTPTEAQGPGDYTVIARVDDGAGGSDQESFVIHVNEVNSNPDLANPGAQSVNEGQLLAIDLSATDPDLPANGLTYSLVSGPAGLTIAANGHLAFTPTEAQGPGDYTVIARVDDGAGGSDQESFVIHVDEVNQNPVLDNPGAKTIDEMALYQLQLTASDPDLPANALTFSLVSGPAGLTIASDGKLSWTPSEAQGPNDYTVVARVSDGHGGTNDQSFTIHVNEVNIAPDLANPGTRSVNAGQVLAFNLSATDPDLPANTLTYSLASGPSGLTIDASGHVQFAPPIGFAAGDYTVIAKVADGQGGFDQETFIVHVNSGSAKPVIEFMGGDNKLYIENHKPELISPSVSVSDDDSANFAGGSLTVRISGNGEAGDRLVIIENGQIDIRSGNKIYIRGQLIGQFSGGDGLNPLIIQLNANADSFAMAKLIGRIGYYSLSEDPSILTREISYVLNDGQGGISDAAIRHMRVKSVNDAPEIESLRHLDTVMRNSWDDIGNDLGLYITDVDADATDLMEVQLKVQYGKLAFSDVSDLTTVVFGQSIGADGLKVISFTASLQETNILLSRLMYKVTAKVSCDTLWIRVNDLGNDGLLAGPQKDFEAFTLKIV